MSEDVLTVIRYIFILSAILILVAYFTGSTQLLTALGRTARGLIYAGTSRTSSGQFVSNAPVKVGGMISGNF